MRVDECRPSEVAERVGSIGLMASAFGHAEAEMAAAVIVLFCARRGDQWHREIRPREVGGELRKLTEENKGVRIHFTQNPFWSPDFSDLRPWVEFESGKPTEEEVAAGGRPLKLTDAFIARCSEWCRWVRGEGTIRSWHKGDPLP